MLHNVAQCPDVFGFLHPIPGIKYLLHCVRKNCFAVSRCQERVIEMFPQGRTGDALFSPVFVCDLC